METLTILTAFGARLATAVIALMVLYKPALAVANVVGVPRGQRKAFGLIVLVPFLLAVGWVIGELYLQGMTQVVG